MGNEKERFIFFLNKTNQARKRSGPWPGLEAKEFISFQVDGSEIRTAEVFD